MLILPAIDLLNGRCVRLAQGDFSQETVYGNEPGAVAERFINSGAIWVHVVDLDGARTGSPANHDQLGKIIASGLKVELGGGMRTMAAIENALKLGVSRVVVGTTVIQNPGLAREMFQNFGENVVAGIDCRDGLVSIAGWEETSGITAIDLAKQIEADGCRRVILTDISRDGMLSGPNLSLLEQIIEAVSIPVIQSGGIGTLEHVAAVIPSGAEGLIIGKALYEGTVELTEAVRLSDPAYSRVV